MTLRMEDSDSSTSEEIDDRGTDLWEDAEPDEEEVQVVSFFDDRVFPDAWSMIEYCKDTYNFDLISVQKQHSLDFYQSIKLVNYIRGAAKNGNIRPDVSSPSHFADDKYLQPVLEDDALLFSLDDIAQTVKQPPSFALGKTSEFRVAELEAQLKSLQSQFADFRLQVDSTLERRWTEVPESTPSSVNRDIEVDYFDSYSYNEIHEIMLKDTIRTDAYRDFIYDNKHLFANKVVLDVGCGTGILSMFCARAGAARVIAVDNSSIIDRARANVFTNGLESQITCLKGKVEEVVLPVEKVDIIVSEWMGYCLLFEAMLDSVLWARDRYLKRDGLMVPSHCILHLAPLHDEEYVQDNVGFWRDVYGFNMGAMTEKIYEDILIRHMPQDSLAAASAPFAVLPLHEIKTEELVFMKDFRVTLERDIPSLDGWLVYFDTFFLPSRSSVLPQDARAEFWPRSSKTGNAFTTGPAGKETHWKAGIMLVDQAKAPAKDLQTGSTVTGTIEYRKAKGNNRGLEIEVKWQVGTETTKTAQVWFMK